MQHSFSSHRMHSRLTPGASSLVLTSLFHSISTRLCEKLSGFSLSCSHTSGSSHPVLPSLVPFLTAPRSAACFWLTLCVFINWIPSILLRAIFFCLLHRAQSSALCLFYVIAQFPSFIYTVSSSVGPSPALSEAHLFSRVSLRAWILHKAFLPWGPLPLLNFCCTSWMV